MEQTPDSTLDCRIIDHALDHVKEHWCKGAMIEIYDDGNLYDSTTSDLTRAARLYTTYLREKDDPAAFTEHADIKCCMLGALALGCVDAGMEVDLVAWKVSDITNRIFEPLLPPHPDAYPDEDDGPAWDGVMDYNDAQFSNEPLIQLTEKAKAQVCH